MRTAKARYTSCPPALSCTDCPNRISTVVRQLTQYAGLCRFGTAWYRRRACQRANSSTHKKNIHR
ncbi:hypothetical protein D3C77_633990 [compost metagenome]